MGQTAQSLICSIKEKPDTGLDDCLKILLLCFRARTSVKKEGLPKPRSAEVLLVLDELEGLDDALEVLDSAVLAR